MGELLTGPEANPIVVVGLIVMILLALAFFIDGWLGGNGSHE